MPNAPFRLRLTFLCLASCLAGLAHGEEGEDLFFGSLPVVQSVSRIPQPLSEAPGAVTVIDRDTIRRSGARDVSEVMRLVPGFLVTPHNQDAPRVAYQGLTNEDFAPRVQVLVDGRSQYSALFRSGVNWNLLPVALDNIERIEVMRGSNAVAYGSNALLGVINIITQDPALTRGWAFSANHGNQSIRDEFVRWGGKVGQADVRLSVLQTGDDGLRKMFSGGRWIDPHDSRHSKVFELNGRLPLTERDDLLFSLTHAYDVSQFGRPSDASDPFRDNSISSTALNLGWQRTISAGEEMKLRFSRVEDWGSDRHYEVTTAPVGYVTNSGGRSITYELDFQHTLSPRDDLRLMWGGEARDISLQSFRQFSHNNWVHRSVLRTFGNAEWRPAKDWLLNLGASLEYDSVSGYNFNPRLAASYHLTPENTFRLSASRAHRTPSLWEAQGSTFKPILTGIDRNFQSAPGLAAERVDTLEAGYLMESRAWHTTLDVRAFHERIPNRIIIAPYALPAGLPDQQVDHLAGWPNGRADAALNLEKALIQGFDYQFRWQPMDGTRFSYGHAYTQIRSDLTSPRSVADNAGNTEKIAQHTRDSVPRHSTSAMLSQSLPFGLEASVMYYKQAFMRWTRNSFLHPYERVDWRLAYPFKQGATRGEIAYTAYAANHPYDGLRDSRVVNETHWITLRLEY